MNLNTIPLSIYFIVILLLLCAGVKVAKKGEFFDDFLSLDISKGLQGFAAVAIMLHHMTQTVTQYGQHDKGLIGIMNDSGVLFTGMFFFFSGYGLYTSFMKKEDYLKGFLKKRLPVVLIPFYSANIIFVIASLVLGQKMSVGEFFLHISGLVLLNTQMWYIVEIVILYLLFYVIFKFIKKQKVAFPAMAAVMLVMTAGSLLLGHDSQYGGGVWFKGEWWYNTTWLFFVGMVIARYLKDITAFVKKRYVILLPVGIVLFVVMYQATLYMIRHVGYWKEYEGYPGYKEKLLTCLVQSPTVMVFVLVFLMLTMKVQFHNRALKFLGKIAIELYLIHNIFILHLTNVIKADILFYLAVYVGGIVLATAIHYMDQWLIKKICKK